MCFPSWTTAAERNGVVRPKQAEAAPSGQKSAPGSEVSLSKGTHTLRKINRNNHATFSFGNGTHTLRKINRNT
jgi:hypothetical protein